jgi:hypothetical protein
MSVKVQVDYCPFELLPGSDPFTSGESFFLPLQVRFHLGELIQSSHDPRSMLPGIALGEWVGPGIQATEPKKPMIAAKVDTLATDHQKPVVPLAGGTPALGKHQHPWWDCYFFVTVSD